MAEENATTTSETEGTEAEGKGQGSKEAVLADLARERDKRQEQEKAARAAEKERDELKVRLEKLEADAMSDQEKAIEKARKEAASEARVERDQYWSSKFVQAEAKAVAAKKLADADDIRLLDLSTFKVKEDGSIDGDISKAVDNLLEAKPHLAATGTQRPSGSADNGTRDTSKPEASPGLGRLRAAYADTKN